MPKIPNTIASTAETNVIPDSEVFVLSHRVPTGYFFPGANLRAASATSSPSGVSESLSLAFRTASRMISLRIVAKCLSSHWRSTSLRRDETNPSSLTDSSEWSILFSAFDEQDTPATFWMQFASASNGDGTDQRFLDRIARSKWGSSPDLRS